MSSQQTIAFVGLYASLPIDKAERRVRVLQRLLGLERSSPFKKMKYGQLRGKLQTVRFTENKFEHVLTSIGNGEIDVLHLLPYWEDSEWIRSYQDGLSVDWYSVFSSPIDRELSPVEKRFGFAGTINMIYPTVRFSVDSESPFEGSLLSEMRKLFVDEKLNYAFIHQGLRLAAPPSIGTDDIFIESRDKFPLTSFDSDLFAAARYYKEFAKGAFWANFLGPQHVEKLGGLLRLLQAKSCTITQELGDGRVLLQVGPSPVPSDTRAAVSDYQRLRHFLKPILLESHADLSRVHREVTGSWKPPWSEEEAERRWQGDLAELRKQYP